MTIVLRLAAVGIAAVALPAPAADEPSDEHQLPHVERVGQLDDPALREVSGMAASRRQDWLLWVHNDSGNGPFVYPILRSGERLGRVTVSGGSNRDWEDMASFEFEGRPMLLIADIGDNKARRSHGWLHVIEEPDIDAAAREVKLRAHVEWSVPFRYPDGAADCEAVAVDAAAGQVLLLTKRQTPPRLYSLPLKPRGAKPGSGRLREAQFIAEVANIPGPTPREIMADLARSMYLTQPTGMDIAGDTLLVLTYLHAYRYRRDEGGSWAQAVARKPDIIPLPAMRQSEAIAIDRHGQNAFVTSEKRLAPIFRLHGIVLENRP